METTQKQAKQNPIFNGEYEVIDNLGDGNTSRVYLCRHLKDTKKKVALKLLRNEFLTQQKSAVKSVEKEISILRGMEHNNITQILGYGTDGKVVKSRGREIANLVYIILEYVPGGVFFDMCKSVGGMGERAGRFFMEQLAEVMTYMDKKKVAHRDLKLENILVDDDLNLKIADFGFATYKNISKLKSFRGTQTYMAPEIREGRIYDGRKVDMFSLGVILFIIVMGNFPFSEAKKGESYYKLLAEGKHKQYWKKIGGDHLSNDFKDLMVKMLNYDPKKRPSIFELNSHPWMKPYSEGENKKVKKEIQLMLKDNQFDLATQDTDSGRTSSENSV